MTSTGADARPDPARPARGGRGRLPAGLGPVVLLLVSGFFIAVVLWGFFNPVEVRVEQFDAGLATSFEIGRVTAFPERDLYIVGLQDGRLRAIDGRVEGSDCTVRWLPDDARGGPHNPGGAPGVFEDPCSGATWSMEANAIAGATEPLRTPRVSYAPGPEGGAELHAFIEHINP